jgi:hypothetical protein
MRGLRLVVPVLALVTACGPGTDSAPSGVTGALARVDRLIAAHQYAQARVALDDLVRRTAAARASGALDEDWAEQITAAAARLSAAMPVAVPATPSPTPAPDRQSGPRGKKGDGKGHHEHDDKD